MKIINLPDVILINHIICELSIIEIVTLARTSQKFKELCNDNSIWETKYVETLPIHKWIITPTSVHIGCHSKNRKTLVKFLLFKENTTWVKRIYVGENIRELVEGFQSHGYGVNIIPVHPLSKRFSIFFQKHPEKINDISIRKSLKHGAPWNACIPCTIPLPSIQETYLWNDETPDERWKPGICDKYRDILIHTWQDHNIKNGLCPCNLCNHASHYIRETLSLPQKYRKYKNYKHILFKKRRTKAKHTMRKNISKIMSNNSKILLLEAKIKLLRDNNSYLEQNNKKISESLNIPLI